MKNIERALIILIAIVGLSSMYLYLSGRQSAEIEKELAEGNEPEVTEVRKDFTPNPGKFKTVVNSVYAQTQPEKSLADKLKEPLSEAEVNSVNHLVDTLLDLHADRSTPDKLISSLASAGLEPQKFVNKNADTGTMIVVRTDETLPGTRYFHAQFFDDGEGGYLAQHISFEIRPGPNSEEVAMNAIHRAFEGIGEPTSSGVGFKEWKTKNCKTISMKKMDAEDLEDDPFNAHSIPEDIGTITVAEEDDPHCHESPVATVDEE